VLPSLFGPRGAEQLRQSRQVVGDATKGHQYEAEQTGSWLLDLQEYASSTFPILYSPALCPLKTCYSAERKIGCDRARPWCANCIGSGRECLGYDVRLLWPDQYDGRRRDGVVLGYVPSAARSELSPYYGQQFLNVTFKDIESVDTDPSSSKSKILVARPIQRVNRNPSPYPRLRDEDVLLLNYCTSFCVPSYIAGWTLTRCVDREKVSTMISTIQSQNGFRSELLPMILSSSDSSASALRYAMMAVSAFHHFGTQAALPYKVTAVRCLSSSLASDSAHGAAETQAAASLMLCVYSVGYTRFPKWLNTLR
jgi:hypothetical protein